MLTFVGLLAVAEFALLATAQLTGPVGPSSSTSTRKATKTCNILDYGGQASKTFDNAQAITSAWAACASGGELLIPEGDFGLSTWISVKNAKNMNFNLEGTIHRTGTAGGNMIFMRNVQNFEFYSANSKGAIQGYGYEFHKDNTYGPRILRFYQSSNFSIHDITLVDAPQFHLSLDTVTNAEVYNMVIRGGSRGGLDGIDVWGDNIWIHDVEVSNKDECVTVKNPSHNFLIEQIHCNLSGGCGMGSIGSNTDISNILYRNVYTHHSNQMYMIKSNGGNGSVSNVVFDNFVGHSNAYTLDLDSAWTQVAAASGDGIAYTNISATGWHGTCSDGTQRGPVKMFCPEKVPCQDITIKDFNVWTEDGDSKVYHVCKNAYGSGSCLDGTDATTSFTSTKTITGLASTAYTYASMDNELSTSIGLTVSIAIPTLPASYFPGMLPISPYNSASGTSDLFGEL
ncbi:rhamnogalacturonase rhgA [Thozetella sp. PMI_491]|nr:rhamnogalacturonase rhgA [Thozetella sp. PMI_491]